jgi:hypothetical protein
MKRMILSLTMLLICSLALTPTVLAADYYQTERPKPPNTNLMAADALVGRPLGLGMTILGTGAFIATLPFTALSGSTGDAARGLVSDTARWTFTRPLGQSDKKKTSGYILP